MAREDLPAWLSYCCMNKPKGALLQELGAKVVQMGWFAAGSEGLQGTLDFLREAPEDHLLGLIKGCQQRIDQPPCTHSK